MCEISWKAVPPSCSILVTQCFPRQLPLCHVHANVPPYQEWWHHGIEHHVQSLWYALPNYVPHWCLAFYAVGVWLSQIVLFLQRRSPGNHPHYKFVKRRLSWIGFSFGVLSLTCMPQKGISWKLRYDEMHVTDKVIKKNGNAATNRGTVTKWQPKHEFQTRNIKCTT